MSDAGTRVVEAPEAAPAIDRLCRQTGIDNWFAVADANVWRLHPGLFSDSAVLRGAPRFVVPPGEENKTPDTLLRLWQWLSDTGATRRSGVINVGGGMVTDLGGFAAATFKRGVPFVNVPTTLLGAVDASVGGKTGINIGGLKNEAGAFAPPAGVVVCAGLLRTLPREEMLSGYAEMLKTGLIGSASLYRSLCDVEAVLGDAALLGEAIKQCIDFKLSVTSGDLREEGRRRILNFGHTAGHAFESLSHRRGRPVAHGVAVAHGMTVALVLSHMLCGLDTAVLYRYVSEVLRPHFPRLQLGCGDYPELLELMGHDKKNQRPGVPSFVLLRSVGDPVPGVAVTADDLRSALDIARDLTE